jgi:fatty-acyl-CoA synthase
VNLLSLLAGQTKSDPHAIIAIDADPDQPQHVSRAELWRRTLQLRADLATAGVGRGDGVLVALPAWSSTLEWYIAVASLGAYVVGVDPGDVGDPAALPDEFAVVLR